MSALQLYFILETTFRYLHQRKKGSEVVAMESHFREKNVVAENVLEYLYKPVCRAEQRRVYAVARLEPAKVTCEVDAYPPPDSFRWSFNHSGAGDAAVEVPEARYSGGAGAGGGGGGGGGSGGQGGEEAGASSTLSYAPMTELDYGTLLCSANNAAGQQREPCVFHIIPAGRPEPPLNCSLTNQTTGSLEVECEEGFDGGLPQTFQLEVFDLESGLLAANVSSRWPRFLVEGLRAGRVLRVHAYALNAKGRSEPFALEGFTLKQAEKRTGESLSLTWPFALEGFTLKPAEKRNGEFLSFTWPFALEGFTLKQAEKRTWSPVSLELTPLLATLLGALAALLLVATAGVAGGQEWRCASASSALRGRRGRRAQRDGRGGRPAAPHGPGAEGEGARGTDATSGCRPRPGLRRRRREEPRRHSLQQGCYRGAALASVGRAGMGRFGKAQWERTLADAEYQLAETPGPLTQGLLTPTPTAAYGAPAPPRVPSPRGPSPSAAHCNGALYGTYRPLGPPTHLRFPTLRQEVQYAELALSRCGVTPPPPRSPPEPTIYAQISHTLRAHGATPRCTPSPVGPPPPPMALLPGREVVTVRTPLMMGDCAQESCV
ncbi:Nephrin [Gryllus bimaculatus]|nr:Nephrin [Gryllus bimaculatus]